MSIITSKRGRELHDEARATAVRMGVLVAHTDSDYDDRDEAREHLDAVLEELTRVEPAWDHVTSGMLKVALWDLLHKTKDQHLQQGAVCTTCPPETGLVHLTWDWLEL